MASKSKLENTLRAAALGGLALAAGAVGEARGQTPVQPSTYEYDIRFFFKVKDAQGNETRDMTPGQTYSLEVWAQNMPGANGTIGMELYFSFPQNMKSLEAVIPSPHYETNDFFEGFNMNNWYNFVGKVKDRGRIYRLIESVGTIGPDNKEGIIGKYNIVFNDNTNTMPVQINLEGAMSLRRDPKNPECGLEQTYRTRSLLTALVPENMVNTPALFYDSDDWQTPANDGRKRFVTYVFSAGKDVELQRISDLNSTNWTSVTNSPNSFEYQENKKPTDKNFYRLRYSE
jgi:hypothetical protein